MCFYIIFSWWSQGLVEQGCKAEWISGSVSSCRAPCRTWITGIKKRPVEIHLLQPNNRPVHSADSWEIEGLFPCSLKAAYRIWSRRTWKPFFEVKTRIPSILGCHIYLWLFSESCGASLKARNCWTASAEPVSGRRDINIDTVSFFWLWGWECFLKLLWCGVPNFAYYGTLH